MSRGVWTRQREEHQELRRLVGLVLAGQSTKPLDQSSRAALTFQKLFVRNAFRNDLQTMALYDSHNELTRS
jgi:hypothetical protein